MLNVTTAFLRQYKYVIQFFYIVEESNIALVAFFVCLSFIYLHLSYAQFSFYGLKIVPEKLLTFKNKQKQNETLNFLAALFVPFIKTQGLQKDLVLKLLANIKRKISVSLMSSLKYLKKMT